MSAEYNYTIAIIENDHELGSRIAYRQTITPAQALRLANYLQRAPVDLNANKKFKDIIGDYTAEIVNEALYKNGFNKKATAEALGVKRTTLLEIIGRLGIV